MPTVIDALVITLGLDTSKYDQASGKASGSIKKIKGEGDALAKGLEQAGKKGAEGLSSIRREALGLLAVFTGGLGLASFIKNTIGQTAALSRTSTDIGLSAQRLAQWQIAAEKAGGSAEGITSALKGATSAIGNFRMGDASGVMSTIQAGARVGVQFDPKEGAEDFLRSQAEIIARTERAYGTEVARSTASRMGVSDDAYHFMRGGAASVDAQLKANASLAKSQADLADRAEVLRQKWVDLSNTLSNVAVTALTAVEPALERFVGWLTKLAQWVDAHRGEIATFFSTAADNVTKLAQAADNAAQSFGGWQNVLIAFAALKIFSMVGNVLALARAFGILGGAAGGLGTLATVAPALGVAALALHSDDLNKGEDSYLATRGTAEELKNKADAGDKTALKKYIGMLGAEAGYTPAQIAGILGNIQAESSFDSKARNGNMYGLVQLSKARQDEYEKQFGRKWTDASPSQQAAYIFYELQNSEKHAGDVLRRTTNVADAAHAVAMTYERPYGPGAMTAAEVANVNKRAQYAQDNLKYATPDVPQNVTGGGARAAANTTGGGAPGAADNSVSMSGQFHFHLPDVTDAGGFAAALPGVVRGSTTSQANSGVS